LGEPQGTPLIPTAGRRVKSFAEQSKIGSQERFAKAAACTGHSKGAQKAWTFSTVHPAASRAKKSLTTKKLTPPIVCVAGGMNVFPQLIIMISLSVFLLRRGETGVRQ
jgi:hypothetical protein